jgi:hypothetical protein
VGNLSSGAIKVKDFGGDALSADRVPPAFLESAAGTNQLIQEAESQPAAGVFVFKAAEGLLPGQIGGSVVDPSGAVLPNALITVTSSDTKMSSGRRKSRPKLHKRLPLPMSSICNGAWRECCPSQ